MWDKHILKTSGFIFSAQVLYVPTHWWHYVESVDPITVSVNSWIELVNILAASLPHPEQCHFKANSEKTYAPRRLPAGVDLYGAPPTQSRLLALSNEQPGQ